MALRIVADGGCSAMADVQPGSGKDREWIFS